MAKAMKMTTARKRAFLDDLALHGLVTVAARNASPHSKNGCHVSFYEERDRDPEFHREWQEALEIADEMTIAEIRRRGIEGYEAPVWGSLGPGQGSGQIGVETRHSDKMAELFGRITSIRVRQALANKIELSGEVKQKTELDVRNLTPEKRALLEQLLAGEDDPTQ